jgi:hypothetical protein
VKIRIKDFGLELNILNRGLEIEVKDTSGKHKGDLYITKTGLTWCKGRTTRAKGISASWKAFMEWMELPGS